MSILNSFHHTYCFIQHGLCLKHSSKINIEFDFELYYKKQQKQVHIRIEDTQLIITANYIPSVESDIALPENDIRYEKKDSSISSKELTDVHPYLLQWVVESNSRQISKQEISYKLHKYGPGSIAAGPGWGNKPDYKFWDSIKIPEDITLDLEKTISLWNSSTRKDKSEIILELSGEVYKKVEVGKSSVKEQIGLEFTFYENVEILNATINYQVNLNISEKAFILKSATINKGILYQYGSSLWPHRLRRNIFGGGSQIFILTSNDTTEFFITEGGLIANDVCEINNISILK